MSLFTVDAEGLFMGEGKGDDRIDSKKPCRDGAGLIAVIGKRNGCYIDVICAYVPLK